MASISKPTNKEQSTQLDKRPRNSELGDVLGGARAGRRLPSGERLPDPDSQHCLDALARREIREFWEQEERNRQANLKGTRKRLTKPLIIED